MAPLDTDFAFHYVIALGSNRSHARYGLPRAIVRHAMADLDTLPTKLIAHAPIIDSLPIGPSYRRYANNAVIIACDLQPEPLLTHLKTIESAYGKRHARRWSSRVLDLDIIMWRCAFTGQMRDWHSKTLQIPHQHLRERSFVLKPAKMIAGDWRDPVTGLTIRQLYCRLLKQKAKG